MHVVDDEWLPIRRLKVRIECCVSVLLALVVATRKPCLVSDGVVVGSLNGDWRLANKYFVAYDNRS